ncbi:MAG: T9SS C-terminal target domain-containing protein [Cytophagales bacterium]|nr:MAG: T9SS C-terminal target domain-containing protein [Cytophagales bacterium]
MFNTYLSRVPKCVNYSTIFLLPIFFLAIFPAFAQSPYRSETQVRDSVAEASLRKIAFDIRTNEVPAHAQFADNQIGVEVTLFSKEGIAEVRNEIMRLKGKILAQSIFFGVIKAIIPKNQVIVLAKSASVQFISYMEAPLENKNNIGRNRQGVNAMNNAPKNLTGNGVIVGIWDAILRPHADFENRMQNKEIYNDFTDANQDDHGNHVAGTVGGAGIINPRARGIAPKSTLFSYSYSDHNNGRINASSFVEDEVLAAINPSNPSLGVVITQNSFGPTITACAGLDNYPSRARRRDMLARTFPFLTQCVAAGNEQAACAGGFTTLSDVSKNAIIVGSVDSTDVIATSSSFGPTRDGRIKPDISAVGENVFSLSFSNQYVIKSGTSMATPMVSGVAALLYERFKQINGNMNPTSDLIKALLCNNADDINNLRPDYRSGFGRLNGGNALKALEENRFEKKSVSQNQTNIKTITVAPNTAELKIMLTWIDVEALTGASVALVNDLNLQVISPDGTIFNPWVLNPLTPNAIATRQIDSRNNIEQVTIDNPIAGNYTISVVGVNIPQGTQDYAITWTANPFYREIIFPTSGQSISPSTNTIIYWQQAGATSGSPQTVEYSTNGGTSWTLIGTVNAPKTSINWNIPAIAPNAQVQVRVSGAFSPNIVANSENFSVMGTPTGFTATGCNAIQLSWSAVAGTTSYDVFAVNITDGSLTPLPNSPVITTNSTDTRALEIGKTYWYAVRARNGSVVGERSVAISYSFTENKDVMVTNGNDSGEGSLREAIDRACQANTISFAPNVSEVLLTSSLLISKNITINGGAGSKTVIIKRNSETPFRIFNVIAGAVNMNNLSVQNGAVVDNGGAILNTGNLTLRNCYLLYNNAGVMGSALLNGAGNLSGTATMINCVMAFNATTAQSTTGTTIQNGFARASLLTLQNCTITENTGVAGRIAIRSSSSSTLNLQNTIINQPQGGLNASATSVVISAGGNISADNTVLLNHATDLRNTDPRLLVFAPAYCSPAVNTGVGIAPATDILGNSRIGIIDRGAIEYTGQIPDNQSFIIKNGNDTGEGSLREAITCAPNDTQITFSSAVKEVRLTSSQLSITKGISIIGDGKIVIRRNANAPLFRIFNIENTSGIAVNLKGIGIANGKLAANANMNPLANGGGIRLANGNLILENVSVIENQSPQGAGIAINTLASIDINNSFITNNIANSNNNNTTLLGQNGGGLFIENGGRANLTNTLIANNIASNLGAGIFSAGSLNLLNVTIAGNRANQSPSNEVANNAAAGINLTNLAGMTTQNTIFHHPDLQNGNFISASMSTVSKGGNLSSDRTMLALLQESTDQNEVKPLFISPKDTNFGLLCYDLARINPALNAAVKTNMPKTDILGKERVFDEIGAYALQTCPIPSPNLSAKAGNAIITLTWEKSQTSIPLVYEIYAFSANTPAQLIGTTTDNTFVINGLQNSINYSFYLTASSKFGQSEKSNIVSARPSIVLSSDGESYVNQLFIYPNPSESDFSLLLKEENTSQTAMLTVINLAGQTLANHVLKAKANRQFEEKISLSHFPSGVYLLMLTTEKGVYFHKIQKL